MELVETKKEANQRGRKNVDVVNAATMSSVCNVPQFHDTQARRPAGCPVGPSRMRERPSVGAGVMDALAADPSGPIDRSRRWTDGRTNERPASSGRREFRPSVALREPATTPASFRSAITKVFDLSRQCEYISRCRIIFINEDIRWNTDWCSRRSLSVALAPRRRKMLSVC